MRSVRMELKLKNVLWVTIAFVTFMRSTICEEDFYSLLGVDRDASVKEIRKAFKKLALSKHPDKSVDDDEAHEIFIRINRAYEVLKDEDLRKKYDQYGEEGLKDDFQRGRQYESWQWYQQNFGIYDDDQEIITLSRADFEQSVEGTDQVWFINFYSTYCSHCHDLAPTWRSLAKELEGVIRIGAVNCQDDWQLCRMQGIQSYPSLVFYPQKQKYYGERSVDSMVDQVLRNINVAHHEIWRGNFQQLIENSDNDLPWLITFCGDGGDCLEAKTCIKLAAMLVDLVNVGKIDCHTEENLCQKLGKDHGTFYFEKGKIKLNEGLEITSLYAQDIVAVVMQQLPDMEVVDEDTLQNIQTSRSSTWLLHFVERKDNHDLELRKLPALLKQYRIGRVDCSSMRQACQKLHVTKYPTFILFKKQGGSEIYYGGRTTAHDVAAFVKDSANCPLENLNPEDFPDRVVLSQHPWFVDFFAPWCPPCMRLLPEFKKAAKAYGPGVNFGTVDCTVHRNLCQMYNINSYPTTIFYNQSIPHQYHGHHSAHHIMEFIKDVMSPPVISLTQASFLSDVYNKHLDDVWLVDFFAPWCGPCQQLAPEWRKLAKMLKGKKGLYVAQVDCVANQNLCQSQSVHSYPTVRLYPANSNSGRHHVYSGWHRDASSLRAWAFEYLPTKVITLSSRTFTQKVLESNDPWIVDFYAPWCGHCQVFRPEFEKVAEEIAGIGYAGKVDCDSEPNICNQAGVRVYPTVRFYKGRGQGVQRQPFYGRDIQSQNADDIIHFIKRNAPSKQIKDEL